MLILCDLNQIIQIFKLVNSLPIFFMFMLNMFLIQKIYFHSHIIQIIYYLLFIIFLIRIYLTLLRNIQFTHQCFNYPINIIFKVQHQLGLLLTYYQLVCPVSTMELNLRFYLLFAGEGYITHTFCY